MYVAPEEAVKSMLSAVEKKASLSVGKMLIRGFLSGAILGYATSLSFVPQSQGLPPFIGAVIFPVGFVILVLMGLELVTGNFALFPMGLMAGNVSWSKTLRNWFWVYIGNLLGGVAYAFLYTISVANYDPKIIEILNSIAFSKIASYQQAGGFGIILAMLKGILCNWMVTAATAMAFFSTTTIGKAFTMWFPIMAFFALKYEHSVVNMFVLPAAIMVGSPNATVESWWIWNQIPVTIGNILGAVMFTSLPLMTHYKK